jgi:hypothetical protein
MVINIKMSIIAIFGFNFFLCKRLIINSLNSRFIFLPNLIYYAELEYIFNLQLIYTEFLYL